MAVSSFSRNSAKQSYTNAKPCSSNNCRQREHFIGLPLPHGLDRYLQVPYLPTPPSWILVWIFITFCLQSALLAAPNKKNVLLLISDDMRPQLDIYKDLDTGIVPFPRMYTPNINELASKSLVLGKAYSQAAVCSPSRTSFLTGRRPDTTKTHNRQTYWRDIGLDFTTLPQYFKNNGYTTVGMGKVFHPGKTASNNDDPVSWSNTEYPYFHAETDTYWRREGRKTSYRAIGENFTYSLRDEEIAKHAIEVLSELRTEVEEGKKFFMAVGFHLPHLPFLVPERYLDYYPLSEIQLPLNDDPPIDLPSVAWFASVELRQYQDIMQIKWGGPERTNLPNITTMNLRRHYYAAVTYIDFWIGQILKTLDDQQLSNDTIVVFMSDHGYQLGEHGLWNKNTNFEIALQVPLMIHVPGLTETMKVSTKIVELIDLFPTLVELAGLPELDMCSPDATITSLTKVCREGSSFRALFDNPNFSEGKGAAFSQVYRKPSQAMGYSVRTSRYRYTEWVRFNITTKEAFWDQPLLGTELYDYMTDPHENQNLANTEDMSIRILIQNLRKLLSKGWRSKDALPKVDWPATSSAIRQRTLSNETYLCLYLLVLLGSFL